MFSFNAEFTSKLRRIKIPLIVSKESAKEDSNSIPASVEEDRKHIVEASIVRIMKARKRLSHNELIHEVMRQVMSRFSIDPQVKYYFNMYLWCNLRFSLLRNALKALLSESIWTEI